MSLEYSLTFAGVPFFPDDAKAYRSPTVPDRHQVEEGLLDEVERLITFRYLQDFSLSPEYAGRNTGALAVQTQAGQDPHPDQLHVGDYYYPNTAGKWSVFRGLATSAQTKAMLAATAGTTAQTFTMKANPLSPSNPQNNASLYTVTTSLFMMPPRPLAEHGGGFDGLYLITLVDERYYFQGTPISLQVTPSSTWQSLLTQLATALGVSISPPTIPAVYGQPEPDSQLWLGYEDAGAVLDAVAYNIGKVVVRGLDGTYSLQDSTTAQGLVATNRVLVNGVRAAGGELFSSGSLVRAGDLRPARNVVVPNTVYVTFPKYVHGDDPVPHFANPRYRNQRPSAWYEESYGDVWAVGVGVASGGAFVSGLTGVSQETIRTTAKAWYNTEASLGSNPINASGLTAYAVQVAGDRYGARVAGALDEVYTGTLAWTPEGIHDIIWSYSPRKKNASTRVMRAEWNNWVNELQGAGPFLSGYTSQRGIGGTSVAQSWRDSVNEPATTTLSQTVQSTDLVINLTSAANLPTQNRWKGQIGGEVILFEGTGGSKVIRAGLRGVDGTVATSHDNASTLTQVVPNTIHGNNLITFEKGQFVFPGLTTSGGIQETIVVPQTQTVFCWSDGGQSINGQLHYSGTVDLWDTIQNPGNYQEFETCWILERNNGFVVSGRFYDGQLAGVSADGPPVAPVYLVSENASVIGPGSLPAGSITSGLIASGALTATILTIPFLTIPSTPYGPTLSTSGPGEPDISASGASKFAFTTDNAPTESGTQYIDGFRNGQEGQILIVRNLAATSIVLRDGSTGLNDTDVVWPLHIDYTLYPENTVILEYDSTGNCWRPDHPTFAASKAGATLAIHYDPAGNEVVYGCEELKFGLGLVFTNNQDGSATIDVSGKTTTRTVVTGFNATTCVATTEQQVFVNGLLVNVI